jgi:hypothetical protein
MMRRGSCIVNEMEFRMWRDAKSFSPSARAGTMQRFQHAPRMLETGAALKRHCPTHPQYGQPFH